MALSALLRDHGGAVEADLQRFYRIDLRDLWRGRLSIRRLAALIVGLPRDCAISHAVEPEAAGWGIGEHIAASIFDVLQGANWQRAQNPRAPHPQPFPRPDDLKEQNEVGAARQAFLERKAQEWRDMKERQRRELTS